MERSNHLQELPSLQQRKSLTSDTELEYYLNGLKQKYDLSGNVALIQSPTFSFEAFSHEVAKNQGYYVYPPNGLQCLQVALKEETGLKADILDLNFRILEKVCLSKEPVSSSCLDTFLIDILDDYLNTHHVSVIGVSAGVIVSNIFGVKNHPFLQILRYLKKRDKQIIISGGVIATNEWRNLILKELSHFVFCGESENRLTFFMKKLLGQPTEKSVCGIHFKLNDKMCESVGQENPVEFRGDLVETYRHIPIEKYHEVGSLSPFSRMIGPEKRYSTIQLNRGCRGRCTFCGVIPFMGKGVRSYPTDSVIKEMTYLAKERGVQHFEWLDDDLLRYRHSFHEVLNRMIELRLNLTWAANNGLIAASLDEETLNLMVQSGCVGFRIGVESGNDEILKKIRKPATKKNLKEAAIKLHKYPNLFVVGCYMIGFQGETYQQILDTFQLCTELNLSWSGFSVYQVVRDSTNITEEFDKSYQTIVDFVPTKNNAGGVISKQKTMDVRELLTQSRGQIHSPENLDEIWFTFNLLSNYVNNKNLKPGGRPEQFIRWTQSLQSSHPTNAVISLFLSLGHTLMDQQEQAYHQWNTTEHLLSYSDYWQKRFKQFSLDEIIRHPPRNAKEVYQPLRKIEEEYRSLLYA